MNGLTTTILLAISASTIQQAPSQIRLDFEEQAKLLVKSREQPRMYWDARSEALKKGLPLVVGVGCIPPKGNWVTCQVPVPWEWCKEPTVVVAKDDSHIKDFHPTVTSSEVELLFRKEVVVERPNPFHERFELHVEGKDKATGPWLPQTEQVRLRSLLPFGVPVSNNLMFYKLPQKAQSLYTMNGGVPYRDIVSVGSEEHPWAISGGMHFSKKGEEWTNATALELPKDSKIKVWEEWTDVGAFGPVPKIRWNFPTGTLAYDVLFNKRGQVFEVRIHEKNDDGWDHGTIYRPKVKLKGLFKKKREWNFRDFGASATYYEIPEITEELEFEPTRVVINDGGNFIPQNYFGTGVSCNTCHSKVGIRLGYGSARRGDDGRFSWHPFDESGRIDFRWPIK